MRLKARNTKGFTLLEILIVLVILAVLAGLAIPAYQSSVNRSRGQEGIQNLAAVKESMQRFFALNGSYAGAFITPGGDTFTNGTTNLDFNPNFLPATGVSRCFQYTMNAAAAGAFSCAAVYQPGVGTCGTATGTLTITQAGGVTGNLQ